MQNYSFAPEFIIRTPLLPVQDIFNGFFSEQTDKEAYLKNIFDQPTIQEALFLASPLLQEVYTKWRAGELIDPKEQQKLKLSLARYLVRMYTRCTPFGTFAGCTVGKWDNQTEITLADPSQYKRHTRLDMHYLCALAQNMTYHTDLKLRLLFYPNTSIYTIASEIRYIDYFYHGNNRIHQISSVDNNPYVQAVLKAAAEGKTLPELAYLLVDEETAYEEALAFIEEMVDCQLLINELEPAITGDEFLVQIQSVLNKYADAPSIASLQNLLRSVQHSIEAIDEAGLGNRLDTYHGIVRNLEQLGTPLELNKLFQVDMKKPATICHLATELQQALAEAVDALNLLNIPPQESSLIKFRDAFLQRFDQQEIPLLQALDTQNGVGFLQGEKATIEIPPLVEGIFIPVSDQASNLIMSKKQRFLLQLYLKAVAEGTYTVNLAQENLQDFEENWENLSDTLSIMFDLVEGEEKPRLYLKGVMGGSAANMFGRFTHADEEIDKLTRKITTYEESVNPDAILAEVIHLPQARVGNILLRTQLRAYEIPFLAKASVPEEYQISLDDLYVSVRNQRVVLRSKRLNKEILPRLTTAHNFATDALPVYQFLCELQHQNKRPVLTFSWGSVVNDASFLPRVIYKNVILHRATWNFEGRELLKLLKGDTMAIRTAIRNWRNRWKIPPYVVLAEFDNELLINLEDNFSLKMLRQELKNKGVIKLIEYIGKTPTTVKDITSNNYNSEFIATLLRVEKPVNQPLTFSSFDAAIPVQREFLLGSEWIYFKFYLGVKTMDKVLMEAVQPLMMQLKQAGMIDHWFFIRYQDPEVHIRLRLHLTNPQHLGSVLATTQEALQVWLQEGYIWNLQTDTYLRELERYGTRTIEQSEYLFWLDSELIVQIFSLLENYEESVHLKWISGLICVNNLLDQFRYSMPKRIELFDLLKRNYLLNLDADDPIVTKQFNRRYGEHRSTIENYLYNNDYQDDTKQAIQHLLQQHNEAAAPAIAEILDIYTAESIEPSLNTLVSSYIHMHFNRLFSSFANQQEMILYDWLYRYYRSVKARSNILQSV